MALDRPPTGAGLCPSDHTGRAQAVTVGDPSPQLGPGRLHSKSLTAMVSSRDPAISSAARLPTWGLACSHPAAP